MSWFPNFAKKDQDETLEPLLDQFLTSASTDCEYRPQFTGATSIDREYRPGSISISQDVLHNGLPGGVTSLRVFTFKEMKEATENFNRSLLVRYEWFGALYKGVIPDITCPRKKTNVTIRQLKPTLFQELDWEKELSSLGAIQHPNIVKLLGYCAEEVEGNIFQLLVYEYMPHVLAQSLCSPPLPTRLKIAQDVACALAYLHEVTDFKIVYNIFKPQNVLFDEQWNVKLDIGFVALDPIQSLDYTTIFSSYDAPEFLVTGHATCKSITWSYGIFLQDLITGTSDHAKKRLFHKGILLCFSEIEMIQKILDGKIEGGYHLRPAMQMVALAAKFMAEKIEARPTMSQVLQMVNRVMCR